MSLASTTTVVYDIDTESATNEFLIWHGLLKYKANKNKIMKKIFAGLAIASVMTACSNSASDRDAELRAKQFTIDSMKAVAAEKEAEARIEESKAATTRSSARRSSGTNTVVYKGYSEPQTVVVREEKKGWSNKAKGAVVGGVVGAVTGAAVSDKKGKGAVIGGVVGAAGGYGVGAILDKKKKQ